MKYLFFDTETTGLPKNWSAPYSDSDNWPRLVQLAWIINDESGKEIYAKSVIIKPEGFLIPDEVSKIHGITTERANNEGYSLSSVLKVFASQLVKCDWIVAHNMSFDEAIIEAEMIRKRIPISLKYSNKFCTMKQTVNFCQVQGNYGYKWPKLKELHLKLFNCEFDDAHNAAADIAATNKCFWELKHRGVINV